MCLPSAFSLLGMCLCRSAVYFSSNSVNIKMGAELNMCVSFLLLRVYFPRGKEVTAPTPN